MAVIVKPEDFQRLTELVGAGLRTTGALSRTSLLARRFATRQAAICERLIAPLYVDEELRRGLADLATEEDYGRADRKAAMVWLLKLVGEVDL